MAFVKSVTTASNRALFHFIKTSARQCSSDVTEPKLGYPNSFKFPSPKLDVAFFLEPANRVSIVDNLVARLEVDQGEAETKLDVLYSLNEVRSKETVNLESEVGQSQVHLKGNSQLSMSELCQNFYSPVNTN